MCTSDEFMKLFKLQPFKKIYNNKKNVKTAPEQG